MNITRHTYEEFFILYMDNELSAEERKAVEAFADQHPDLKGELELLMHTRVSADDEIVFTDKDSLLKYAAPNSIYEGNSAEWLLSYIDNELNNTDLESAENLIASNPAIAKDLDLLLTTKFQPAADIVFPNKESLYRREEKTPVVIFQWKRIAVAAAILFAIATGVFLVLKNNSKAEAGGGSSLAKAAKGKIVAPTVTKKEESKQPEVIVKSVEVPVEKIEAPKKENLVVAPVKKEQIKKENKSIAMPQEEEKPMIASNEPKKDNSLPKPTNNPNVTTAITDPANSVAKNTTAQLALTNPKEIKQVPVVTTETPQPLYTSNTSMQSNDDNIEVEQPGRKNKLRGFFRKVTRTIERTTNIKTTDDEDRLLLGSLAIKL